MLQKLQELFKRDTYFASRSALNTTKLDTLQQRMTAYYLSAPYPEQVRSLTANWHDPVHVALCGYIPSGSRVLEVGCGNGAGAQAIKRLMPSVSYVGCDLSYKEWAQTEDLVVSSADTLAFPDHSFDVVFSLYVIEHLVFPARFLDECWRVLHPGGRLLVVAPNFSSNGMASERIGLSYGPGQTKLRRLRVLDAALTAYDSRVRIPPLRRRRQQRITQGICEFPVLAEPRCLRLTGFVPDCDALYPACASELEAYMQREHNCSEVIQFYSESSTFGLMITKRS